jgi:hypothetical protein
MGISMKINLNKALLFVCLAASVFAFDSLISVTNQLILKAQTHHFASDTTAIIKMP